MKAYNRISKRRAEALASGVFLISLGILFYFDAWWPGILLAIGAFLVTRQTLTGRLVDSVVTTFILGGLFIVMTFNIPWSTLGPLLFIMGGGYILFREYFLSEEKEELPLNLMKPHKKFDDDIGGT